tara:strand:- start:2724 stop:3065 length:342 start_codon:yes stop_codon:yes gene_type:complete
MTIEILAQRVETLEKQMADLLSEKKKTEKKAKKEKKKSKDTDDDEPKKKKGPSGYLLYSKAMRDEAKEKLAKGSDEKPKSTEIMKELGAMWKALSDDEREGWNDKAKELKDDA